MLNLSRRNREKILRCSYFCLFHRLHQVIYNKHEFEIIPIKTALIEAFPGTCVSANLQPFKHEVLSKLWSIWRTCGQENFQSFFNNSYSSFKIGITPVFHQIKEVNIVYSIIYTLWVLLFLILVSSPLNHPTFRYILSF